MDKLSNLVEKYSYTPKVVRFSSPPASPTPTEGVSDNKLEFFLDGIKFEVWQNVVKLSKEHYSVAKGASTGNREIEFSHTALQRLVSSYNHIEEEYKLRNQSVCKGLPNHDGWFLQLEDTVHVAINYYKGKNLIHVRKYSPPQMTPTQDGVTLSLKALSELGEKATKVICRYFNIH